MYSFSCSCESLDDATKLSKEKFFCILRNYCISCCARNLPDYGKEVERLRAVHGTSFDIKFVDSHTKTNFKSSDSVLLCPYSTCTKTELSKILDESCFSEFQKFVGRHYCPLVERCRELAYAPKTFFDTVAPKQYF